jgi:hypothetical protein
VAPETLAEDPEPQAVFVLLLGEPSCVLAGEEVPASPMWRPRKHLAYMYVILGNKKPSVKRFQQETVTCTRTGGSSGLRIKSTPLEEK